MTPPRPPLRLGWRRRAARQLRIIAARLEDRRVIPHRSGVPHRLRDRAETAQAAEAATVLYLVQHPAVRADLEHRAQQVALRARMRPRGRWAQPLTEEVAEPGRAEEEHRGGGELHACRCDSWRILPSLRGTRHGCRCPDDPDEQSHLPAGMTR